jgi:hypothetical protein
MAARSCLTALNVIGGITSLPSFCDMNPDPHIAAVRSRARLPLVLLLIICLRFSGLVKRTMLFYNHVYPKSSWTAPKDSVRTDNDFQGEEKREKSTFRLT